MKLQSKEFIAGSFVIGGLIGFLAIVSLLGSFLERTDPYFTKVNNVSGLKTGAAVIYEGYIIGSVAGVTPEASDEGMTFRIDLEIEKDWQIPETSEASIAAMSLLSAVAIQIRAGEGPALEPGAQIATSSQKNFVDEISQTADNFARIAEDHLVPLLNTMNTILEDHGAETFDNLNVLTSGLAAETPAMARNINALVQNLDAETKEIADNLDRLITSIDPDRMDKAMGDVEVILENTRDATATINSDVLPGATGMLDEGKKAMRNSANIIAGFEDIQREVLVASQRINTIMIGINALVAHGDDIMVEGKDITFASGEQLATILNRLDRAALNIEEMTNILKANPGVLITGTE